MVGGSSRGRLRAGPVSGLLEVADTGGGEGDGDSTIVLRFRLVVSITGTGIALTTMGIGGAVLIFRARGGIGDTGMIGFDEDSLTTIGD